MLNNSTDDIDNNEVISINNRVTTTKIIFCLPLSSTLNWLHGTVLSNTLRKTLGKLLGIELGIILGNKLGITLHDMTETALCVALEIELEELGLVVNLILTLKASINLKFYDTDLISYLFIRCCVIII